MMLSDRVQVSERFKRSIRIDTDLGDEGVINSFICPQSSVEVLLSMSRGRQAVGEAAFTWTGPYGSGKSSLVIALNALLGKDAKLRNKAIKAVGEKNSDALLKGFSVTGKKGWEFLPVVGRKSDVAEALITELRETWNTKYKITKDNLIATIKEIAEDEECGIFIVIDEMGKFLEAAADGESDVFLFQQLAEAASRSKGKIILLGILHQAFSEYGRRLTRDLRDEWSKIQGRFVDLPLNVAGEELIDLVGRAIKCNKKSDISKISKVTAKHIAQWRPVHEESLADALNDCWPLHPVTASLLGPISRRRFGQNQRSVFGFLNSAEPHGFQEFLKYTSANTQRLYTPALLWDYLRANLEPSIMASPDGHKWSQAVDALSKTEAVSKDQATTELVKCIALMDLFQERSGVLPETDLLTICLPNISSKELSTALATLERQCIIRYKKHKKAYSLFEGSDFDIDSSIQGVNEQIPELDFDKIRQAARFQPIVAKKHYHETGALRWLDVDLVPAEQALKLAESYQPKEGGMGLVMIVLGGGEAGNSSNLEQTCKKASSINPNWPVFVSAAQNSWLIRSLSKELQSLEWIRANNPSLSGDTVARREVETRLADIRNKLEENLASTLASANWHFDGKNPAVLSFKELHTWASQKADELYNQTPKVNSELVNRIKPSSNSVAALKALLKAMAERQGEERLGIVGYPAEGGLFETLLANTGLIDKDHNKFKVPTSKNDPCRLVPLWAAADQFFKANKNRAIPVTEVYKIWLDKPFGVKEGLLPFFLMSYLLTRSQDYAVYREGVYKPSIDSLFIDYLMKSPRDISLRSMNFSALGQKILAGVVQTLNQLHPDKPALSEVSAPLEIARRLVGTVLDLPAWVLNTRQLSTNAIRLRELIKNASDPNKVLFDDLPNLFKEHSASLNKGDVEPIIVEVDQSLKELVAAYPQLLKNLRQQLIDELEIEAKGSFKFGEINLRAKNIMQISGDFKLDAFAARLSTYSGSNEDLEGLASLAADKPTRDWIDLDVNRARLRIAELSQQFNHLEAFGRVNNRQDYRQAVAFMVGLNGKPRTFVKEFTIKVPQQKLVQELEDKLQNLISSNKKIDNDLLLAALANLGARILEQEENSEKPKKAMA